MTTVSLLESMQSHHDGHAYGEWLDVSFGRGRYGIPLAKIREIVVPRVLTRVPRSLPSILGLMSLRGRLITVYDPSKSLAEDTRASEPTHVGAPRALKAARILLLRGAGDEIALRATELHGVVRIADLELEPPTVLGTLERPHIWGVARHDGQAILLLKLEELMREIERA
jgi:purine-binding chemotaxis protein CheW